MTNRYINIIQRFLKILLMTVRGKAGFGGEIYSIQGLYPNRFAISVTGVHEEWLNQVFRELLILNDGAFIDVGANMGQTLGKILSIDRRRQYVGFEPQVACCFFLQQFISQNRLETHHILPIGLSNHEGLVKMRMRQQSFDPTASLVERFRPDSFYSYHQYVFVACGDDVLPALGLPAIALIKIDVEGGELDVLEGMTATLEIYRPLILFEVLNHYLVVSKKDLDEETIYFREKRIEKMEKLLRKHGYVIYNILGSNGYRCVDRISPSRSSNLRETDYLAVPTTENNHFRSMLGKRILDD